MFQKVLIANRGEIAVRIARGLRELGVASAAVYSEPDRAAPHVLQADEAYALAGASAAETYLRGEELVRIARQCGAEAVHPGYGFLSENADFAQLVEDAGLCFIGPTPAAIRAMGDKVLARRRMEEAGVPVVPGWMGDGADADAAGHAAEAIGYPVLVKAAAGGGGKGMRLVESAAELAAALESARREAERAFGDGRVYLERYIARPRHVEVQVFGDGAGRVVHLFERECSIQRRHQKIVEESPSPALTPELREKMCQAAVRAAEAVAYRNAGTVELLLDEEGRFYFLEMNTRLQVEHPVTEMVTGVDLLHAQIRSAAGEPLPFSQESLVQRGHAVECRIYAEDPTQGFLPDTGRIVRYREPAGPGIRVDSGVCEGTEVTVHYDPLLAKVIAWGADREAALARMDGALSEMVLLGVWHNAGALRRILRHEAFRRGEIHTHFLEEHPECLTPPRPGLDVLAAAAAVVQRGAGEPSHQPAAVPSPWREGGGWRIGTERR